jgi:hypothetical protein
METRDIPPQQWPEFLDQFSRRHQTQRALIQTRGGPGEAACVNACDAPLLGITDERPPRDARTQRETIEIIAGTARGRHYSHSIDRPLRIRASEWNDGYSASLEIESADGNYTTLHVGPPAESLPPGLVTDGINREDGQYRV